MAKNQELFEKAYAQIQDRRAFVNHLLTHCTLSEHELDDLTDAIRYMNLAEALCRKQLGLD